MASPHSIPFLRRRDLMTLSARPLHRPRNWSKADVSLVEWPVGSGRQIVVKDFARKPLWFRLLAARILLTREWRALRALQGIDGVPRIYQRIDADAFAMEYCPGQKIRDIKKGYLPQGLICRIENVLQLIHQRGVTHGDLHASNILITSDGAGFILIDWATACLFRLRRRDKNLLFRELTALDRRSLAKIKESYAPELITDDQRQLLKEGGTPLYRACKTLRRFLRQTRKPHRSR